ncbi:MAG: hypothetical protein PUI81_08655 [Veillonellaceae bacterium]|nr:hypothetical protein [Veillonellaceae bacterium]MDD6924157.1 hypothetical protein [Veillonellaceae bacterium]
MSYILLVILIALTLLFIIEMHYTLKRSTKTNELIQTYVGDMHNPALVDEIWNWISQDRKLRPIIKKYGMTKDDIPYFINKLMTWGDFKKGRRYIPISSFFFTTPLKYMLKHRDADPKKLTMRMMNFFHI